MMTVGNVSRDLEVVQSSRHSFNFWASFTLAVSLVLVFSFALLDSSAVAQEAAAEAAPAEAAAAQPKKPTEIPGQPRGNERSAQRLLRSLPQRLDERERFGDA